MALTIAVKEAVSREIPTVVEIYRLVMRPEVLRSSLLKRIAIAVICRLATQTHAEGATGPTVRGRQKRRSGLPKGRSAAPMRGDGHGTTDRVERSIVTKRSSFSLRGGYRGSCHGVTGNSSDTMS